MTEKGHRLTVLLAEFENPAVLVEAAGRMYESGYRRFDAHSPFPVHGMDRAMGLRRSPLGWIVGLAAVLGVVGAMGLQWWTSTIDYPLVISGKPFFSFQAYVPVTFALGVLLSAFAALIGMLVLNGLPRFFHPIFNSDRFARVSDDGFFISVESDDPLFEETQTGDFLKSIGGKNLEVL